MGGPLPANTVAEITLTADGASATFTQSNVVAGANTNVIDFASSFGGALRLSNASFVATGARPVVLSSFRPVVEGPESGEVPSGISVHWPLATGTGNTGTIGNTFNRINRDRFATPSWRKRFPHRTPLRGYAEKRFRGNPLAKAGSARPRSGRSGADRLSPKIASRSDCVLPPAPGGAERSIFRFTRGGGGVVEYAPNGAEPAPTAERETTP